MIKRVLNVFKGKLKEMSQIMLVFVFALQQLLVLAKFPPKCLCQQYFLLQVLLLSSRAEMGAGI